jgi:CheY-like chemotaxis protein
LTILPPSAGWGEDEGPGGAVGQVARQVAHDLNNVLTVIMGNLQLAERHAAGNPKLLRLLGNIRLAAERGSALSGKLMAHAGAEPGTLYGACEEAAGPPASNLVMVVEDDPQVAEVAQEVLSDMGLRVELHGDAPSALAALRGGRDYALVFSDIVMPGGMSGIDLAEAIVAAFPSLPVLLATGFSTAALSPNAMRFPVLAKPYSVQELTRRVRQMLPGL